jgi:hypothetical protein
MNWVESVQSDLKMMKEMAERGGRLTMPGGEYYVVMGVLVGSGLVWNVLVGAQILALPFWTIWAGWFVVVGAGALAIYVLSSRDEARPDSQKLANRIVGQVWMMAGISMGLVFLTVFAAGQLKSGTPVPPTVISMYAFFACGVATGTIAGLVGLRWMYLPSVLWFAGGIASLLMPWTAVSVLGLAVYVAALHIGTGLVLLRFEAAQRG